MALAGTDFGNGRFDQHAGDLFTFRRKEVGTDGRNLLNVVGSVIDNAIDDQDFHPASILGGDADMRDSKWFQAGPQRPVFPSEARKNPPDIKNMPTAAAATTAE